MSANIEEKIIEKLRALPPDKQEEVLRFTEDLSGESVARRLLIFEEIDAIVGSVPPEAWDDIPTDGSINHDHYLYGAPKKE